MQLFFIVILFLQYIYFLKTLHFVQDRKQQIGTTNMVVIIYSYCLPAQTGRILFMNIRSSVELK